MTTSSVTLRRLRLVRVGPGPEPVDGEADVRVRDGLITEVGPALPADGGPQIDAQGRWAIPGLWDAHVHFAQWSQTVTRLDVSPAQSPDQVTRLVAEHIRLLPDDGSAVVGFGYRSPLWTRAATVAELDAVSAGHPVVLISGDAHNGWLNTAALTRFGVHADGPLDENDWFAVFTRLPELTADADPEAGYPEAAHRAAAKGVVGVVDMEFGPGYLQWPQRVARGLDVLRVRPATYPDRLDEVITAGLGTGQELPGGAGLLRMGPLKIITDGSLSTRTAYCCEPFADAASAAAHPRGKLNVDLPELTGLMRRAATAGLQVAAHAIGDAAVANVLAAFEDSGALGSVEHAQLIRRDDLARMARLPVRASVQPAHLLDDRDVTQTCWPDRMNRCFPLRSLLAAGVELVLGSDAPIAALDPWLAMAAAVHRSGDEREPWNPGEALTVEQALAASTDGLTTLAPGQRADLVVLERDPLERHDSTARTAQRLRTMPIAATLVGGRVTFSTLDE